MAKRKITIGIAIRAGIDPAVESARELIEWAEGEGHQVLLEDRSPPSIKNKRRVSAQELVEKCDPIVTLGGDGTLIGVARFVSKRSPVMIGVNYGRLGFLTEIAPNELLATVASVLSNRAEVGERYLLKCEVVRNGKILIQSQAVNDVVIHKGVLDGLMDLDLYVDQESVMRLRTDGVIVATPTGSTAYSLAAGGAIVHPALPVILLTPICPHSLTNRPLILDRTSIIEVVVPNYEGEVFLSIDGQEGRKLQVGDTVRVTHSKHVVNFVRSSKKSYFEILRTKLNWGIPNSILER